jgi:hypothetical protein
MSARARPPALLSSLRRWAAALSLYALSAIVPLPAATMIVVNMDGPNEGLNDPTPFAPFGSNFATTLGQARLNVIQHAANLLGALLVSNVPIVIEASMDPLGGNAAAAPFGSATPYFQRDFAGAPLPNTWYAAALANKLSGTDVDLTRPDIVARFNSDIDKPTVLGETKWYYGLDARADTTDIDFVTVVLHELVHGLGFFSTVNLATGAKADGFDDAFMLHLEHHGATPANYPAMSNAQRVAASKAGPNLHWTGPATVAAAGGHVEMYAPDPPEQLNSVAHFSTSFFPDQLMEPFYRGPNHQLGLAAQVLRDMGWTVTLPPPPGSSELNPPSGITTDVGANGLHLRWNAVTGATGYRSYYGYAPGSYIGSIDWGNVTEVTIKVPPGTYYGALTAYNGSAESSYSKEQRVVVPAPTTTAGE